MKLLYAVFSISAVCSVSVYGSVSDMYIKGKKFSFWYLESDDQLVVVEADTAQKIQNHHTLKKDVPISSVGKVDLSAKNSDRCDIMTSRVLELIINTKVGSNCNGIFKKACLWPQVEKYFCLPEYWGCNNVLSPVIYGMFSVQQDLAGYFDLKRDALVRMLLNNNGRVIQHGKNSENIIGFILKNWSNEPTNDLLLSMHQDIYRLIQGLLFEYGYAEKRYAIHFGEEKLGDTLKDLYYPVLLTQYTEIGVYTFNLFKWIFAHEYPNSFFSNTVEAPPAAVIAAQLLTLVMENKMNSISDEIPLTKTVHGYKHGFMRLVLRAHTHDTTSLFFTLPGEIIHFILQLLNDNYSVQKLIEQVNCVAQEYKKRFPVRENTDWLRIKLGTPSLV